MNTSPNPRFAAAALGFAALVLAASAAAAGDAAARSRPAAPPAQVVKLELADAEAVARSSVAPFGVQAARCFRPVPPRGPRALQRAFCLVSHPAPAGEMCNSLVSIWAPRGDPGAVRARVVGSRCFPLTWPVAGDPTPDPEVKG
jgi:hypothetical protein